MKKKINTEGNQNLYSVCILMLSLSAEYDFILFWIKYSTDIMKNVTFVITFISFRYGWKLLKKIIFQEYHFSWKLLIKQNKKPYDYRISENERIWNSVLKKRHLTQNKMLSPFCPIPM